MLNAAEAAVSAREAAEDFLPLVDQYIELFNAWYASEGPGQSNSSLNGDAQLKMVQSVLAAHDKVIAAVRDSKSKTSGQLQYLRRKGKGILSYIDTLPKHLSIRGTRKG